MKKYTIDSYYFHELPPQGQENALNQIRYKEVDNTYWWENKYAECEKIMAKYGIEKDDIYELSFFMKHNGRIKAKIPVIYKEEIDIKKLCQICDIKIPHESILKLVSWFITDGKFYIRRKKINSHQQVHLDTVLYKTQQKIVYKVNRMFKELDMIGNTEYKYRTSDKYLKQYSILSGNYTFTLNGMLIPDEVICCCKTVE